MTTTENKEKSLNLNKPAYVLFLLTGLMFLYFKDISQAVIFLGLAIVFDPFDINVPFNQRPFYQKAWLIGHLGIVAALFGFMVSGK